MGIILVSVNFWYDMDFDIKYVYYKFVERLSKSVERLKRANTSDNRTDKSAENSC